MSDPAVPVVVTKRFERAVDALLDHCEALRHLHPDAGTRAWQWVEAIESRVPQMLGAQPNIGRREAPPHGTSGGSVPLALPAPNSWRQEAAPLGQVNDVALSCFVPGKPSGDLASGTLNSIFKQAGLKS